MQETLLETWFGPSPALHIPGLSYIEEAISLSDEMALIQCIDQEQWQNPYQRRTQMYGSSTKQRVGKTFPPYLQVMAERIRLHGHLPSIPNLLVINEYLPGQGIGAHRDDDRSGDHIAILSISSAACMELSNKQERKHLILKRRSLCLLSGAARWEWQHAIPKRHSDIIAGVRQARQRRLSLTFRISN